MNGVSSSMRCVLLICSSQKRKRKISRDFQLFIRKKSKVGRVKLTNIYRASWLWKIWTYFCYYTKISQIKLKNNFRILTQILLSKNSSNNFLKKKNHFQNNETRIGLTQFDAVIFFYLQKKRYQIWYFSYYTELISIYKVAKFNKIWCYSEKMTIGTMNFIKTEEIRTYRACKNQIQILLKK